MLANEHKYTTAIGKKEIPSALGFIYRPAPFAIKFTFTLFGRWTIIAQTWDLLD